MRAINTSPRIKQSKVILATPQKKTFLEEGGQPSASVVLELHAGKTLTPEQVRASRSGVERGRKPAARKSDRGRFHAARS